MGTVYLGRAVSGRPVAVKVVRPDLADDTEFRARFRREVAAARRVGGFWAAQVVDADAEAERPWMATAYVAGPSLQEAVGQEGALPASVVRRLGATLAEGLAAIHAHDLVHRDLKPSNILLADDGPRVVDFGIALERDATSLTRGGAIGTAPYMSPEQVRGQDVTAASDVFSLGSVLVFACTGRSPFGSGAPEVVARRVVEDEPDLQGVPAGLLELVRSCLAKEPGKRPAPSDVVDRLAATTGGGWELPVGVVAMIADRSAEVGGSEAGVVPVSRHDPDATERVTDPGTRKVAGGVPGYPAGSSAGDPARDEPSPVWWRSRRTRWLGVGVAGVAAGVVAALAVAGVLSPEEGAEAAGASPGPTAGSGAENMFAVPDETHEVTLEVTATGKDAGSTAVGVRYDGNLGPLGVGDSFRSQEDRLEMDPAKMYTEIDLPWTTTITAQGTVEGADISLSAEAGWRDRTAMIVGDVDIAVSCRILIDGKVVVEEAGQVNVGCMLLPEELQKQMDEMRRKSEEAAAKSQEEWQKDWEEQVGEPGSPEYEEWLQNMLDKAAPDGGDS
jgi:hypothetical protein